MTFEEWWNDQDRGAPTMVFNSDESMARAAYAAGYEAARERAAEAVETKAEIVEDFTTEAKAAYSMRKCAEAIRGMK